MPGLPPCDPARFRLLEPIPLRLTYRSTVWEIRPPSEYDKGFGTRLVQVEPPGRQWCFSRGGASWPQSEDELYRTGFEMEYRDTLPRRITEQLVNDGRAERVG